jgi:hypothetical protein
VTDKQILPFERQFDEIPTKIGQVLLGTDEVAVVHIHHGMVEVPIYPPEEMEDDLPDLLKPFLLQLSPREARDLAGLLIYAAGRAEESAGDRCIGCDKPLTEDDDDE